MFAVVYIPDFPLQAVLRFEPDSRVRVAALLDANVPKASISHLTAAARASGVSEGMTATQAMARCSNVLIKNRSLAQEKAATDALLRCAFGFSPAVEATADGVVTLDWKGFSDLPVEAYGRTIIEQARLLQLDAQVGVAENPLLALYAARSAQPFYAVANSKAFLSALPIEAIEPSAETLAIVKKWGIHTVGFFLTLGCEALAERLGAEGVALFERASAHDTRPLRLVRLPEQFEERIEFEHEIETAEPLLFVLRRFIEQIAVQMEMSGNVVEELTLRLLFSAGPPYEHVFKVPEPTRNQDALFRMLHMHLESLRTEHSIVGLQLSGKPCVGRMRQFGLFETALRDPYRFSETLARLSALVGADRVGTPMNLFTHRPDAFRMARVDFERERTLDRIEKHPATNIEPPTSSPLRTGLPLRLFRPPLKAHVELSEACPVLVKMSSFSRRICNACGPWRTSGDWWDQQAWSRDEWDVQTTDGGLYRLYEQEGSWFVEGIYD